MCSLIRAVSVVTAALVGAGLSLTVATTAFAHAEVEVEPARAGATDALVTVLPEAHHHNGGVISVEVFPPDGMDPAGVTLVSAPDGWELTTGEESYTISGDELEIDESPLHEVRVAQLPDAPEIYFRILVTYRDGQVDRWIELPSDDNPSPSNAAPGVELAGAGPVASPTPGASEAPNPSVPASPEALEPAAADQDGSGPLLAVAAAVAVLVAAVAGWAIARRRNASAGGGGAGGPGGDGA